jgi:hypothetical protein
MGDVLRMQGPSGPRLIPRTSRHQGRQLDDAPQEAVTIIETGEQSLAC